MTYLISLVCCSRIQCWTVCHSTVHNGHHTLTLTFKFWLSELKKITKIDGNLWLLALLLPYLPHPHAASHLQIKPFTQKTLKHIYRLIHSLTDSFTKTISLHCHRSKCRFVSTRYISPYHIMSDTLWLYKCHGAFCKRQISKKLVRNYPCLVDKVISKLVNVLPVIPYQ